MYRSRKLNRPAALLSIVLSLILIAGMMPPSVFAEVKAEESSAAKAQASGSAAEAQAEQAQVPEEGTCVPGEVIVVFRAGAVKDKKLSIEAATALENVGDDFGSTMGSAGEEAEAAKDAKSEINILKESLGDDFTIEDSIAVDEDLIMALVKSEKYKTEVLIEKLSENEDVESAEPNYVSEQRSYEYSLDDQLAQYAYGTNSPEDVNKAGRNVSSRGEDPAKAVSIRSGSVTDFQKDHSGEKEVVVAVVDSGINYDHEELKNMLWVNDPEKTGLEGQYGFNFEDNDVDVKDTHGHGTHCSGIIAAQANNGKGIAGVASGTNVKIMMCACSTSDTDPEREIVSAIYRRTGALYYVLRAKQAGVNVVAASCSWGSPGECNAYNHILNKLGEAGVLTFVAAGNEAQDIDVDNYSPEGSDSPYTVIVGSANIDGKPSAFTNIGRSNMDVFSPGSNILSAAISSNYFPNLYTAEERAGHTEYYGQFSSGEGGTEIGAYDAELGTEKVIPDTAGEGVKPFGAAKFFAQDRGLDEEEEGESGSAARGDTTCELSISSDKTFTDNYPEGSALKPGSLKVTIKNARYGKKYFLYFPYAKNHATTGLDNTRYSIDIIEQYQEGDFQAEICGGEIVKYDMGGKAVCKALDSAGIGSDEMNDREMEHFAPASDGTWDKKLLSWEEADPEKTDVVETGIGISIAPESPTREMTEKDWAFLEEAHDITVYIDALGVSRPVTEEGKTPDDVFPADSSYVLMSGTSQATPAAAGAYAVLASLYPMEDGQDPAEYARENRNRLLSLVTRTDELKDLCSTGGYIDLTKIKTETADKKNISITDAVCDMEKETLTLSGIGITPDLKLYARELSVKDAEEVLIADERVSFADDGKSLVISGAKDDLFGRYKEFILKDGAGETRATGSFFTVKGQKPLECVLSEEHKETVLDDENEDGVLLTRSLFTDPDGETLYAFQMNATDLSIKDVGVLYRYDGSVFAQYQGTGLRDSLFDYYEKELGYDRHQLTRGFKVAPWIMKQPLVEGRMLYHLVDTEYSSHRDAEDEDIQRKSYLASMDYTAEHPKWKFMEIQPRSETIAEINGYSSAEVIYGLVGGKIYMLGSPAKGTEDLTEDDKVTFIMSLDVESGEWERLPDYRDVMLSNASTFVKDGKMYIMFADAGDGNHSDDIWVFDGKAIEKLPSGIPFCGRHGTLKNPVGGAACTVKEGFILFNFSVSGAGNVFLYRPDKGTCEPLYYTTNDGLSTAPMSEGAQSAVETKDGLYYIALERDDGNISREDLYLLPKSSHAYKPAYKDDNPMTVTVSGKTVTAAKLKKKPVKVKAVTVRKAEGTVTYRRGKITCAKKLKKSAKAKIKVSSKTGKITLKKGLKKGKYTVAVKVAASGNDYYKAGKKTVKVKITVK